MIIGPTRDGLEPEDCVNMTPITPAIICIDSKHNECDTTSQMISCPAEGRHASHGGDHRDGAEDRQRSCTSLLRSCCLNKGRSSA